MLPSFNSINHIIIFFPGHFAHIQHLNKESGQEQICSHPLRYLSWPPFEYGVYLITITILIPAGLKMILPLDSPAHLAR